MLKVLISIIFPALVSWLTVKWVLRYASSLGLVQQPNERSSHIQATPHGGGLGIVVGTTLFTLWLMWYDQVNYLSYWLVLCIGLAIAFKGLLDDIYHLPALLRLGIQAIACFGLISSLQYLPVPGLNPLSMLPYWPSLLMILFASLWWLNLFNFMDGIDGLAATQGLFMLLAAVLLLATQHPELTETTLWFWALGMAAATLGFLAHNWSPASIFMGDTGSMFLAFMILFLALLTVSLEWMNYASWMILGAVFISDASFTLLKRLLNGENIFRAHHHHIYQRLARHWDCHAKVTKAALVVNITWLLPNAWLALVFAEASVYIMLLAYFPLTLTLFQLNKKL